MPAARAPADRLVTTAGAAVAPPDVPTAAVREPRAIPGRWPPAESAAECAWDVIPPRRTVARSREPAPAGQAPPAPRGCCVRGARAPARRIPAPPVVAKARRVSPLRSFTAAFPAPPAWHAMRPRRTNARRPAHARAAPRLSRAGPARAAWREAVSATQIRAPTAVVTARPAVPRRREPAGPRAARVSGAGSRPTAVRPQAYVSAGPRPLARAANAV